MRGTTEVSISENIYCHQRIALDLPSCNSEQSVTSSL